MGGFRSTIQLIVLVFIFSPMARAKVYPKIDPFEFELLMTEHQLGVETTMLFLQERLSYEPDSDLSILVDHPELVRIRASQHDMAKLNQTPEFLQRYQLINESRPLVAQLSRYYGLDLRDPRSNISQEDRVEARRIISRINQVDQQLARDTLAEYLRNHQLDPRLYEPLLSALNRLEIIADFLNRKVHEILINDRRGALTTEQLPLVYEFGHSFEPLDPSQDFWKSHPEDVSLLGKYVNSPLLLQATRQATSELLVEQRLQELTQDSPYLKGKTAEIKAIILEVYKQVAREKTFRLPILSCRPLLLKPI